MFLFDSKASSAMQLLNHRLMQVIFFFIPSIFFFFVRYEIQNMSAQNWLLPDS